MSEFGIITAETVLLKKNAEEIPAVILVGRDENGNKHQYRKIFYPYFYINEDDYVKLQGHSLDMYVKDAEGTEVRSLVRQSLTKLTLKHPKLSTIFSHYLLKYSKAVMKEDPIFTYEADLSQFNFLALRMLIDSGVKCGVRIGEDSSLKPTDFVPKLRKWYIDFEALSDRMGGSGPRRQDPIPIVTFYDSYEEKYYTFYVENKKWIGKGENYKSENIIATLLPRGTICRITRNHEFVGCKTEALLLDCLLTKVKELDPDLFTAWNLDNYDIIKWAQRMVVNNLDPAELSPFKSFGWHNKPYKVKGRILFDMLRGFKKFTDAELVSYSLGAVAESEGIPVEKVPLKKSTQWIWDNEPWILFQRNVNDVKILVALDEKYEIIELFDDLRREFGAMFTEVLMNYRVIDTALMRMVNGRIALRSAFKGDKEKTSYMGAVVVEPKPAHYSYVAQFDFTRLYPSLIVAFNIGPDTYRKPDYKGKQEVFTIEYQDKIFKFLKSPRSLPSQLIQSFFAKRDEYEVYEKEAIKSGDKDKAKAWDRKVYNIKKMTNAIYGVMDFGSFRLYNQNCSAATAILGRIGIEEIAKFLDSVGYVLLYGDTDSVFVELKRKNQGEAIQESQALSVKINEHLIEFYKSKFDLKSAPSGMGLKKVYDSFLLIAKKNYAGRSFWDEKKGYRVDYDFKGLEVIRSDSSAHEKSIMNELLHAVLDRKYEQIPEIRSRAVSTIKDKDPLEISYPMQITKQLKIYPKANKNGKKNIMPAHVRAAVYCNTYLSTDYGMGDKPRRLPILVEKKGKKDTTIGEGQQTLFAGTKIYPTDCTWNKFSFRLKDISISEDFEVPQWFKERIDWERIIERLEGKMNKITEIIKHER